MALELADNDAGAAAVVHGHVRVLRPVVDEVAVSEDAIGFGEVPASVRGRINSIGREWECERCTPSRSNFANWQAVKIRVTC